MSSLPLEACLTSVDEENVIMCREIVSKQCFFSGVNEALKGQRHLS